VVQPSGFQMERTRCQRQKSQAQADPATMERWREGHSRTTPRFLHGSDVPSVTVLLSLSHSASGAVRYPISQTPMRLLAAAGISIWICLKTSFDHRG
jgi:hypothetical protein